MLFTMIGLIDSSSNFQSSNKKMDGLPNIQEGGKEQESSKCIHAQEKYSHGTYTDQIIHKTRNYFGASKQKPVQLCLAPIKEDSNQFCELLSGIDQLISLGAQVVCLPLGITINPPFLFSILENSIKEGILLVCPSGNKGSDKILSPGICPGVLCVGAVDEFGKLASFSGTLLDKEGKYLKPEILAPGVNIEISFDDEKTHKVSGTSFACAHVAGLAAALLEANPVATTFDVKMALFESCTPAAGSRYGIVNAKKAMQNILNKVPYPKDEVFTGVISEEEKEEIYIDPRLKSQCKRAVKTNNDVEALVTAVSSATLIERMMDICGDLLVEHRFFQNFDMVHIKAKPAFYDVLFKQQDIKVCNAVDINYFDL